MLRYLDVVVLVDIDGEAVSLVSHAHEMGTVDLFWSVTHGATSYSLTDC